MMSWPAPTGCRATGCRGSDGLDGGSSREQPATVIHTSGTTANPKGAMLSHGNLLFNFEAAIQVVDFYETDVFLCFLPLSHIYGRIVDEVVRARARRAVVYAEAAHRAAAGQHGRGQADRHGLGAAPLRARVRARLSTVESGSTDEAAHLPLGRRARDAEVREPPGRAGPTRRGCAPS